MRVFLTVTACAFLTLEVAAQGSTGGSVGKSDQSISGGPPPQKVPRLEKAPARESKPAAPSATACKNIVGSWAFTNGVDVVIRQDGTASATNGANGRWSCVAGSAVVAWPGWTDRYSSSDGAQLSGIGGLFGEGLSARRK
jgi:hypothetical protein